jgi:hypothetical protein
MNKTKEVEYIGDGKYEFFYNYGFVQQRYTIMQTSSTSTELLED